MMLRLDHDLAAGWLVARFSTPAKTRRKSALFTPVEDIIPKDAVNFDDYLDSVLNYYRIDGQTFRLTCRNSSNAIFYYNKNAFEEAVLFRPSTRCGARGFIKG